MDFDPHSMKWQCCCCSLPSGMKILAGFEFVLCTAAAAITLHNVANQKQTVTSFEISLIAVLVFMAATCLLLIVGTIRHAPSLLYPSLVARGVLLVFLAVFGVSVVTAPHSHRKISTTTAKNQDGQWGVNTATEETNVALRLVLLVFGMLFLTVLIMYIAYLVVRLIHFEQSFARLKERRASLIHAGMIDPDYSASRRTSSA